MSTNYANEMITFDNVSSVIDELETAFYNIPFENSDFQNKNFVLASQLTPERAYRALGLKMFSKIQALREAKYARLREEVDIEELNDKINDQTGTVSKYDKKRAQIDLQQKYESRGYTNKLINDAIHELNELYGQFKAMPRYTREDFENAERDHFQQKLTRSMQGVQGAAESLVNMDSDYSRLQDSINKHLLNRQ